MNKDRIKLIEEKSFSTETISQEDIKWLLTSDEVELLSLLHSAYKVKYKTFENKIRIHILNNVQNGSCSENCSYCAQSKDSTNTAPTYPMKSEEEIIEGAKIAYESGAYRYCMVFSGKDIGNNRISKICDIVKKIKEKYKIDICISAGFLSDENAKELINAGVNRYNHNINTSPSYYKNICTSHDYKKRIETIYTAKNSGLEICSGIIVGMGESLENIIEMIEELKRLKANSIPINFFIPVEGHRVKNFQKLTPQYCLKFLAVLRLAIPNSEIRAAAGREYHMRGMQSLCLFAVNSVFANGYLTTGGDSIENTKNMIKDAGFIIDCIEY